MGDGDGEPSHVVAEIAKQDMNADDLARTVPRMAQPFDTSGMNIFRSGDRIERCQTGLPQSIWDQRIMLLNWRKQLTTQGLYIVTAVVC